MSFRKAFFIPFIFGEFLIFVLFEDTYAYIHVFRYTHTHTRIYTMSGAKRRTKYRKHVTQDFTDSERVPNEGEVYAQVGQSHGGNILKY